MLHIPAVCLPVRLGTEGMDRGAFPPVQHPILDTGVICRQTHFPAQGVQFPHKMPLAGAADSRIAGHVPHGVQIDSKKNGVQSQPGGSQGRLDARVTGSDHRHITASCMVGAHASASSALCSGRRKGCIVTSHRLMGVPRA